MVKIKEEEVSLRNAEAKIQVERLKVDAKDWGLKPLLHAYCGEHEDRDIYEIDLIKNRDGRCASFQPRNSADPTDCIKCLHRSVPPNAVQQQCQGVLDPKLFADCVDAVYKNYGLEVLEAWIGKGIVPHPPIFQASCTAYTSRGTFALCDFFNMRGTCPRFELNPKFAGSAF